MIHPASAARLTAADKLVHRCRGCGGWLYGSGRCTTCGWDPLAWLAEENAQQDRPASTG